MAYVFQEDKLPKLISVVPGRERTFFVNKELTNIDDMLAGIMHYVKGGSSPYHLHKNCEHFYFIMEGYGAVESEEGVRDVGRVTDFHSGEENIVASLQDAAVLFRVPAPNRFVTTILDGRRTTFAGIAWKAEFGFKRKTSVRPRRNSCLLLSIRTSFHGRKRR